MSVSALRSLFIDTLRVKGCSERTVENYVTVVAEISRHFNKSPLLLSSDDVRNHLLYLQTERRFAPATVNLHISGLKLPGGQKIVILLP